MARRRVGNRVLPLNRKKRRLLYRLVDLVLVMVCVRLNTLRLPHAAGHHGMARPVHLVKRSYMAVLVRLCVVLYAACAYITWFGSGTDHARVLQFSLLAGSAAFTQLLATRVFAHRAP
jgi:hypothetical protein